MNKTRRPRGRGRPAQPAVTRDTIAAAALELTLESGYDKLTMSALARHVGVAPSALYNHIANKAELLVLLQDAVMGLVDTEPLLRATRGEISVADALRAWARSYRDVFAEHTPLVQVIATLPVAGAPRTQEMYDAVAAALFHAGVPAHQVMPRVVAMESFIYGSAFDTHAPAHIFEVPAEGSQELPELRRATEAFKPGAAGAAGSNPYAEEPFTVGLDLLLADL